MATRGLVSDGKTTRYVHYDSYPSAVLPLLQEAKRQGLLDDLLANDWAELAIRPLGDPYLNADLNRPASDIEWVYVWGADGITVRNLGYTTTYVPWEAP